MAEMLKSCDALYGNSPPEDSRMLYLQPGETYAVSYAMRGANQGKHVVEIRQACPECGESFFETGELPPGGYRRRDEVDRHRRSVALRADIHMRGDHGMSMPLDDPRHRGNKGYPNLPEAEAEFHREFLDWMRENCDFLPGEKATLDIRDERWVSGLRVSQVCKVCGKFAGVRVLSRAALEEDRLKNVMLHRQMIQNDYRRHLGEAHGLDEPHLEQPEICVYCGEEDPPHAGCILAEMIDKRKVRA